MNDLHVNSTAQLLLKSGKVIVSCLDKVKYLLQNDLYNKYMFIKIDHGAVMMFLVLTEYHHQI